ncbi:MAG: SMC family ATPase, partial [Candidatus Hadarchaeota archaeon]|nr:SMC family ATPase [Candidatus Hadarchaeota archaeon]
MITGVKLRNWKSHEETELRLGDGTNVLVGIMGSGKSAVLDAITYALFGTVPAVQNRTIKLEDLIRTRPRQANSTEVEVRFVAPDENEYVVKRIIERGRGTVLSEFRRGNGELIESPSSTRVSEAIQSILKLDYDLFERAIYSEQNHLDYFLTIRRGERMRKMDELLGINKMELARKNMTTLINRITSRSKDREGMIDQLQEDAALASLPALEQELEESRSSRDRIRKELEQLQPKLKASEKQLKDLQEVQEKLTRLDKSFRELEGVIATLNQQIEQIKGKLGESVRVSPEELRSRGSELQQTLEKKEKNVDILTSNLTSQSSQISGLNTEVKLTQERLTKLSSEIERKQEAKRELEKLQLPQLKERVEQLQENQQKIESQLAASLARTQD